MLDGAIGFSIWNIKPLFLPTMSSDTKLPSGLRIRTSIVERSFGSVTIKGIGVLWNNVSLLAFSLDIIPTIVV